MASYQCEKCGRVFEVADGATGAVCPVCATPVSAMATDTPPELVTDPERQATIYQQALQMKNHAVAFGEWETAGKLFRSIAGYRDADTLAAECQAMAEKANHEAIYIQAKNRQGGTVESLRGKAELMRSIAGYRDADVLAETYQQLADELAAEAEQAEQIKDEQQQAVKATVRQRDRRHRRILIGCISGAVVVIAAVLVISLLVVPNNQYQKALDKFNHGDYIGASELFANIAYYRDSTAYLQQSYYHLGQESMSHRDYLAAEDYLDKAGGIEDAQAQLQQVRGILYEKALAELEAGEYAAAQIDFDAVGSYEDAKAYKHFCRALQVWNGENPPDADKLDVNKAADAIWKVTDGVWYSEEAEQEITIYSATRESDTPDLTVVDNTLQWQADGVTYTMKLLSKTTLTLEGNGPYAGTYEKA